MAAHRSFDAHRPCAGADRGSARSAAFLQSRLIGRVAKPGRRRAAGDQQGVIVTGFASRKPKRHLICAAACRRMTSTATATVAEARHLPAHARQYAAGWSSARTWQSPTSATRSISSSAMPSPWRRVVRRRPLISACVAGPISGRNGRRSQSAAHLASALNSSPPPADFHGACQGRAGRRAQQARRVHFLVGRVRPGLRHRSMRESERQENSRPQAAPAKTISPSAEVGRDSAWRASQVDVPSARPKPTKCERRGREASPRRQASIAASRCRRAGRANQQGRQHAGRLPQQALAGAGQQGEQRCQ